MLASMWRLLPLLFALCASQALFAQGQNSAAFAGKRLALVIGNAKYPTAPLKNPVNDARGIAKALKELGFEVTLRENAGQRDLAAAIRQFGSSITPGSAALFYFAGHGMQVKGRNYLVPVDADIQVEDEVPYSTIDVSLVLDKLEVGKSAVNIVILDACRNNPFARRFRSAATGLAQMDAPIGTLIAFATAPGSVAQDGTGENGVYTKHLLESIAVPGLAVEQMFKRVRIGVAKDTHDTQVPWESSSMKGDFVFMEAPRQAATQDKLIEEAVKAAAERAAALTAERMRREQAASPLPDRVRAEQEALAAERAKLLQERERLEAERAALRKEPPPARIAAAAPTAAAAATPAHRKQSSHGALPEVGDRWTYRYSDGYGKTLDYTVRVTAVSDEAVADELSRGKARLPGRFEPGLEFASRLVDGVSIREVSPYLQGFGAIAEGDDWKKVSVPGGGENFTAKLAGTEAVKVPGGDFETVKVVIEGRQLLGSMPRKLRIEVWYAPAAKRFVKMAFSAPGIATFAAERDVIELVDASLPLPATTAAKKPAATVASLAPLGVGAEGGLPKVGDTWTYRYYDVYGKQETYTVRVTAAGEDKIEDELRSGKSRHAASFEPGLMLTDRTQGNLSLREISPYLLSLGLQQESVEWGKMTIVEGSPPFTARLAGTEAVSVPAGTFEARKVIIEGQQYRQRNNPGGGAYPYVITLWYAPGARRLVKARFDGPQDKETIELVEFRLQ